METVSSIKMLKSITEMLKILSNQNNRCADLQALESDCMSDCNKHMPATLTAIAQLQLLTSIPSIMFVPFKTVMACKFLICTSHFGSIAHLPE